MEEGDDVTKRVNMIIVMAKHQIFSGKELRGKNRGLGVNLVNDVGFQKGLRS